MVKPNAQAVHARAAIKARRPAFPQGGLVKRASCQPPPQQAQLQSWENNCAQTAIIPTNRVIDASAAASSTNNLSMSASSHLEHMKNIVPFLFSESSGGSGSVWKIASKNIAWLIRGTATGAFRGGAWGHGWPLRCTIRTIATTLKTSIAMHAARTTSPAGANTIL
jgi:hypothetical protein